MSLIAKELGADERGQILSVVVCATLPMVILQGSSTQNDAVEALWLTCLVYFLLVMRRRQEWFYPYLVGMSLGLALLTKATAYLLAPPFLIWFGCISCERGDGLRGNLFPLSPSPPSH